ncbi:hypothetical protein E2C01_049306 [Portunus trituberculatus]|uniref:Uncharacterized protein n=1 Tax=Portunus trituberculatus TaxID=210409 RepID=A0A5B7GDL1_PORTR|nr:hypothetical protein [Portunus trituberculatus]
MVLPRRETDKGKQKERKKRLTEAPLPKESLNRIIQNKRRNILKELFIRGTFGDLTVACNYFQSVCVVVASVFVGLCLGLGGPAKCVSSPNSRSSTSPFSSSFLSSPLISSHLLSSPLLSSPLLSSLLFLHFITAGNSLSPPFLVLLSSPPSSFNSLSSPLLSSSPPSSPPLVIVFSSPHLSFPVIGSGIPSPLVSPLPSAPPSG